MVFLIQTELRCTVNHTTDLKKSYYFWGLFKLKFSESRICRLLYFVIFAYFPGSVFIQPRWVKSKVFQWPNKSRTVWSIVLFLGRLSRIWICVKVMMLGFAWTNQITGYYNLRGEDSPMAGSSCWYNMGKEYLWLNNSGISLNILWEEERQLGINCLVFIFALCCVRNLKVQNNKKKGHDCTEKKYFFLNLNSRWGWSLTTRPQLCPTERDSLPTLEVVGWPPRRGKCRRHRDSIRPSRS